MIDAEFIMKYTNGLYCTDEKYSPSYREFRDMFSAGQLKSKMWAVSEMKRLDILRTHKTVVVGGWFGTLGVMLKKEFSAIDMTILDIDPRCKIFLDNIHVPAITEDMFTHDYTEDFVVNTACEHISNIRGWLDLLNPGTLVLLQSNNFDTCNDHINCVYSTEEFRSQTNLSEILYIGELVTPMYTRFMIIGKV